MIDEKNDKMLFDRIANNYSKKDIYPVSRLAREFQLFSLINLIDKEYFEHVVDLGCGTGFNASYLKDKYSKYTGVDYSSEFIAISRKLHSGKIYVQGNIKNLDQIFKEKPDLILGVGVLHHIDDLNEAFKSIKNICNSNTELAFIEPYNGNPIVQLCRVIRKKIDSSYSEEQLFFSRKELKEIFTRNGFKIESIRCQGYFSTPFAQIILKPAFLFYPLCWLAIKIDTLIQHYLNIPLSWNIQIIATIKNAEENSI